MKYKLELQARDPVEFDTLAEALRVAREHLWFVIEVEIEGIWIEIIDRDESRSVFR